MVLSEAEMRACARWFDTSSSLLVTHNFRCVIGELTKSTLNKLNIYLS